MRRNILALLFLFASFTAGHAQDINLVSQTESVWNALQAHCGQAFEGVVTSVPEGDTQLAGVEEIVVHFDSCTENVIRVPFHLKKGDGIWNRSTLRSYPGGMGRCRRGCSENYFAHLKLSS